MIPRRSAIPLLCAAFAAFLVQVYLNRSLIWDDAFIVFRYAEHLSQGLGLVWNQGAAPVEGYTSLLYIVLLALLRQLGIPFETGSLTINFLAVVSSATLLFFWPGLSRAQRGSMMAAAVASLYLVNSFTATNTASRLETHLFALLLLVSYAAAGTLLRHPRRRTAVLLAVLLFLSVLCRPEGVVYAAGLFVGILALAALPSGGGVATSALKTTVVLPGLTLASLLGVYGAWKLGYFGHLLPNSFYLKANQLYLADWAFVASYLVHLGFLFFPVLLLLVWPGRSRGIGRGEGGSSWREGYLVLPGVVAHLGYNLTIIHEVGGAFRFSYPTLPLLALLLISTLEKERLEELSPPGTRRRLRQLVLVWPLVVFALQGSYRFWDPPTDAFGTYHQRIADALAATELGPAGRVVTIAAGRIPFVSRFTHLDPIGLTDQRLSGRFPTTPVQREEYIWDWQGDVFVGFEPPASRPGTRWQDEPRMDTRYVRQTLLGRQLRGIESRIFVQDPEALFFRMQQLREDWLLLGDLEWPGMEIWGLRSMLYVRRGSPHVAVLIEHLLPLVATPAAEIDYDQDLRAGAAKGHRRMGWLIRLAKVVTGARY